MRTDRVILMNTLSPDPICKRYQMRMRWRGILAGLALEALAAAAVVAMVWYVCTGIITR